MNSGRSTLDRWGALALLALFLAGGIAAAYRMQHGRWVEGSFTALLPTLHRAPAAQHALDTLRQRLDRQVVLLVGHRQRDQAVRAAARLASELAGLPGVASVRGAQTMASLRQWAEFYGPYRDQLLTPELRALLERQAGHDWSQRVVAQVYSPMAGIGSGELAEDPFLLLRTFLLHLGAGTGGKFQVDDGWTLVQDDDGTWYALILAELGFDAYSLDAVQTFADAFAGKEAALKRDIPGLTVHRRAVAFFASYGAKQARQEVSLIGFGSMAGALAIAVLVFRSPLSILLVLLAGTMGLLAGFTSTLLLTGPLHLLTLVFGASLVGIADDYPVYYLCDRLFSGADYRPAVTRRRIVRGLFFCLVTSVLAYLALLVAPAPVLRQIALFSAVGLVATFAVVMVWFPYLAPRPTIRSSPRLAVFRVWQTAGVRFARQRGWGLLALGVILVALAAGIRVDDDVRQLQALPGALIEQDAALSRLTGIESGTQLLLVQGASTEQLLQRTEGAQGVLDGLVAGGALRGYRSIAATLPSAARQEADLRLVQRRLIQPELAGLAATLGLRTSAQGEVLRRAFRPLTAQDWLASPVSAGLRNLLVLNPDGSAHTVVILRQVVQPDRIARAFAGTPDVEYIDAATEISKLLGTYRQRVGWLTAVAYLAILALLARLYGVRRGLLVLAPPLLGGAAALALLHALGQPLNLFSLFGVVLVLGAGIDFPLILAENTGHHPATQISVPYSTATTLLSFGLLALSSTPALANFGLVVLVGVLISGLLAPIALPAQPGTPAGTGP